MTIINTGNTASTIGSAATSSAVGSSVAGSMTQADFLKLMTTQLQSQDPTKPVDNSQFVSQMAQFSQLSATQDLLTSMNGLNSIMTGSLQASQLLGSSNLIDRQVLVPSTTVSYSGSTVTGAVNVANAGDVKMSIFDAAGNAVRTIDLGNQGSGFSRFSWDGRDDSGNPVAQGTYSMAAGSNGSSQDTYAAGTVTAVGYGGSSVGTYLQVAGVGGVPLSQVAQIL